VLLLLVMTLLRCPSGNENYRSQRPIPDGCVYLASDGRLNVAMPIKIPFSDADILRMPLAVYSFFHFSIIFLKFVMA
jgi:hypothetical protein